MAAQVFGLDIGRSFIKVVQVKVSGQERTLIGAAGVASPVDISKVEVPADLKKISKAISDCVKSAKISGEKCVVSIMESQAVTRLIDMPDLTDKELSAAINFEADQYIPLPIKDVNIHYEIISRPAASSAGKMQVLLVAAPKRVINKYTGIMQDAGFILSAMETESSALSRALTRHGEIPALIVSMGASSTEIILAKEGNVLFSRSIGSGGLALTKAIVSEFNLTQSQAEQYKMAYGLLEDKLSGKIAVVLRSVLDILISEILKALEFSRSHITGLQISRIIICGGGSYLPGLSSYLAERTSIEVLLSEPWRDFEKSGLILKMPGQGSFYSVATGLALHGT